MATHTPGPWTLWTGSSWRRFGSESADRTVCEPIVAPDRHPDLLFRNGGANGPDAHLIAAAPELYEALVNLVGLAERRCGHLHEYKAALDVARAAIAKAEGR